MVAVAPGAAGPSDGPPADGTLDSLFEPRAGADGSAPGRARTGPAEARTTTIYLSGAAADPAPGRRPGAVRIRDIVGARPRSGRWPARARRTARFGTWAVGAATVGVGLLALWVLLFSTVSGGDVWLGHPLSPASKDEPNPPAQQNAVDPAGSGAASVQPTPTSVPTASAGSHSAGTPQRSAAATHGGGSGSGSGTTGRNGADDPPGDDSGGTRTQPTTGATSGGGSGSGSGSGGSGSSGGGSGNGGGSGGHGADD